jgi:putative ABC transport system substrate-binding protein
MSKILRAVQPADLPFNQPHQVNPTKFEPFVNLRREKPLGLTIPPSLLLRADQVIE